MQHYLGKAMNAMERAAAFLTVVPFIALSGYDNPDVKKALDLRNPADYLRCTERPDMMFVLPGEKGLQLSFMEFSYGPVDVKGTYRVDVMKWSGEVLASRREDAGCKTTRKGHNPTISIDVPAGENSFLYSASFTSPKKVVETIGYCNMDKAGARCTSMSYHEAEAPEIGLSG
ncbi:MAG: hypothetical protein HY365_02685 [Candidatus Aenigmarchaeota archaeon]|nr:hypothetical protein [Candidatus Aenigmarchaeota archaeon]